MTHAVIRVRSDINVRGDISDTMKMLRLNKVNHCVLIQEDKVTRGMLLKVKDYVTWGEVDADTLTQLIVVKGRLPGGKPITPEFIKDNTEFKSVADLAKAIAEDKVNFSKIDGVKPVFRLHPPLKGYEGIKRSYKAGGALGYRGENVNRLIMKMLGPEEQKAKAPAKKKAAAKPKTPKKAPKAKKTDKTDAADKKPAAKKKKVKKVKKEVK